MLDFYCKFEVFTGDMDLFLPIGDYDLLFFLADKSRILLEFGLDITISLCPSFYLEI